MHEINWCEASDQQVVVSRARTSRLCFSELGSGRAPHCGVLLHQAFSSGVHHLCPPACEVPADSLSSTIENPVRSRTYSVLLFTWGNSSDDVSGITT